MTNPERPINTSHAFCSLIIPGLGQLLQKRPGAAVGFFAMFFLTGITPIAIVFLRSVDGNVPLFVLLGFLYSFFALWSLIVLPFLLVIFCAVLDAAAWKEGNQVRFKTMLISLAILYSCLLFMSLLMSVYMDRETARRAQCAYHMKQIALAFHNYHGTHGHFPPAYTVDEHGNPLHSWRVLILPYLYQNALYEKIRMDEPWDSEHNRQFHDKVPDIFQCPSAPRKPVPAPSGTFYSIIYGAETPFTGSQPTKFEDVSIGLPDTILLVERRTPVNWMDPSREIPFETAIKEINVDALGISSYHPGGVNVALGDGSVRFITDSIDHETLRAMLVVDNKGSQ